MCELSCIDLLMMSNFVVFMFKVRLVPATCRFSMRLAKSEHSAKILHLNSSRVLTGRKVELILMLF